MSELYAHPPLIEALCEFHFDPQTDWDWTIPGRLYDMIKKDFSATEQVSRVGVNIVVTTENVAQQMGAMPLTRFKNGIGNQLIQVGPNLLSVHHLAPYSSWELFFQSIHLGLDSYSDMTSQRGITRLTLRYINQCFIPEEKFNLEEFFSIYPSVHVTDLQDYNAFIVGIQASHEGGRDILNLELRSDVSQAGKPVVTLDIGYALQQRSQINYQTIYNWIEHAHTVIQSTFESSITEKLRALFR